MSVSRLVTPRRRPSANKSRKLPKEKDRSSPVKVPSILSLGYPGYFFVEHSDGERFTVNSNCICKIVYEYIRLKAGIPDEMEFDLCDDGGRPIDLYDKEEGTYAFNYLLHKRVYYIFILQRSSKDGVLFNPRVLLHVQHPLFQLLMTVLANEFSPKASTDSRKRKRRTAEKYFHKHHDVIF